MDLADDELLSFAYGSNMASRYLRQECPSATAVMRAALPNYRIEFRRFSTNMKGGISTIMEAPGDLVHGILYRIRRADFDALDALENLGEGLYRRETFLVLGEDGGWHKGDLYRVARPAGPFKVASAYLALMLEGAREHGLPDAYIESLEALA
ncbi:MAG: gamma-glutamylcyclotransferase family protein [Pseudomonadota bacterium]